MSCPDLFQLNCANYEIKCHDCAAINLNCKSFYYQALYDIGQHPYVRERKQQEVNHRAELRKIEIKDSKAKYYNSRGRTVEKKVIKSIAGAKLTYNSGHTNGDGDGYIYIDDVKYGFSHKMRFSHRNQLGPTSAEWAKGKTEGTDFWLTTSTVYGTIVTMKQDTFDELIELIQRLRQEYERLNNDRP